MLLVARHGCVPLRLRKQIGDELSIRRRLRLDLENLENLRSPRRKRVRSQTPLLPLAFPRESVVEVGEKNNGPLGPSFVHELNALEEEKDYDRAAREERPERDRSLPRLDAVRDEQPGGYETGGDRPDEQCGDNSPAERCAEQQRELDV